MLNNLSVMGTYTASSATTASLSNYALKASPTFTGTVNGITATMVGLGNVSNTSDANKPISTATLSALNLLSPIASPTFTGTVKAPSINATTSLQVGGADISTIYQTIANMSAYPTTVALSNWLTTSAAATTYQPQSAMSNYLTTSVASYTYQTTANMSNYLTTSTASTTYQTLSSMVNYLSITSAGSTYQPKNLMTNYLTTATATSTYQTTLKQVIPTTGTAGYQPLMTTIGGNQYIATLRFRLARSLTSYPTHKHPNC